jgi:hypothetical protein
MKYFVRFLALLGAGLALGPIIVWFYKLFVTRQPVDFIPYFVAMVAGYFILEFAKYLAQKTYGVPPSSE